VFEAENAATGEKSTIDLLEELEGPG